jgi:hypothetical protein
MLIAATVEVRRETKTEATGRIRGKYCVIVTDDECHRGRMKSVSSALFGWCGRLDTTISSILFTENDTKEFQECSLLCVLDV